MLTILDDEIVRNISKQKSNSLYLQLHTNFTLNSLTVRYLIYFIYYCCCIEFTLQFDEFDFTESYVNIQHFSRPLSVHAQYSILFRVRSGYLRATP